MAVTKAKMGKHQAAARDRGRTAAATSAGAKGSLTRREAGHPPTRARGFASSLVGGAARVAGVGMGVIFAATALLRRSKPLHPTGIMGTATLTVTPDPATAGSPLLDEPAEYECLVRESPAVGTGPEHADIEGFALRVPAAHPRQPSRTSSSRAPASGRWAATLPFGPPRMAPSRTATGRGPSSPLDEERPGSTGAPARRRGGGARR